MSGVHDGRAVLLCLALQKVEEVCSGDDVEVRRDFVKQQHLHGAQELQEELHSASLAVRHLVHAPLEVDAEQVNEHFPALGERALEGQHHLADLDVSLESAPAHKARAWARSRRDRVWGRGGSLRANRGLSLRTLRAARRGGLGLDAPNGCSLRWVAK